MGKASRNKKLKRERKPFLKPYKLPAGVGKLHDALKDSGYEGHDLERFLVRLVFCLFADDTGIFEPRPLREFFTGIGRF